MTARAALAVVGLMTTLSASSAMAQTETFALPAGCTAFLTVQSKACSVEHHFTCEGDPAGHQRRVALNEEGMTYLGTIDAETQWINSFHPFTGHSERLEADPVDPASFAELIGTNRDSYDFMTLSDEIGTTRYVGEDRLDGRTEVIDGITLDVTDYNITAYDANGKETWSARGNEYISRDWRMFLSGTGTVTVDGETFEKDDRPVEFIFPGEPGFLSANPKYDCGAMISSAPAPIQLETPHDNI